jgi:FMN phosphatase YigB (HAD superfamily)
MRRLKLVIFDLDDTLFDTSGQLDETYQGIGQIVVFPGVESLLKHLVSKGVFTAIVSTGNRFTQIKKIEILRLRNLVDAVHICKLPEGKLNLFRRCFREFDAQPRETLVVGDRIDQEIRYGKMLGCVTVRVLQGKRSHMAPGEKSQEADFSISNIGALSGVINKTVSQERTNDRQL